MTSQTTAARDKWDVMTIGDPGEPATGWIVTGIHGFDVMREAVEWHSGAEITEHHVLNTVHAGLECFECGRGYPKHQRGCSHKGDDDAPWAWNFKTGPISTAVMRDGRSIHLHLPKTVKDQTP